MKNLVWPINCVNIDEVVGSLHKTLLEYVYPGVVKVQTPFVKSLVSGDSVSVIGQNMGSCYTEDGNPVISFGMSSMNKDRELYLTGRLHYLPDEHHRVKFIILERFLGHFYSDYSSCTIGLDTESLEFFLNSSEDYSTGVELFVDQITGSISGKPVHPISAAYPDYCSLFSAAYEGFVGINGKQVAIAEGGIKAYNLEEKVDEAEKMLTRVFIEFESVTGHYNQDLLRKIFSEIF